MWVRLDDRFPWHPKVIGLSHPAFRTFVEGLCYAGAHLTNGFVPAPIPRPKDAGELVKARLWIPDGSNGWIVHDFHDWNPSADDVRRRRLADAERKRRSRDRPGRGTDGRYESRRDSDPDSEEDVR